LAGNFLWSQSCVPILLSRRAVDSNCVDSGFHAFDHRSKSSRTRHHLRLFRTRQPTLEFPCSPRNESRNSRGTTGAWLFESVEETSVKRTLCVPVLIGQRRRLLYNSTHASFERAANIR